MTSDREDNLNEPGPAVIAPPQSPSRRFQFSLASLLWLTTFIVCLAALWAMYRELRQARNDLRAARDEVQKYRGEMGYLDVTDANKMYARRIRTTGVNQWSWRVYLPQKRTYSLRVATSQIPVNGIPGCSSISISTGEVLVDASAGPAQDGRWRYTVKSTKYNATTTGADVIGAEMKPLISASGDVASDDIGSIGEARQEDVDLMSPLVLLRLRKMKVVQGSSSYMTDPQPCDGLMIWIEAAK